MMHAHRLGAADYLAPAVLALPWLWPLATGPSSSTIPWLVSVACACVASMLMVARPWRQCVDWWVTACLTAGLLNSVIGLLQYFGVSSHLAPLVNVNTLGDAYGNLRQRNQFASLMSIGWACLVWGSSLDGAAPQAASAGGGSLGHRLRCLAAAVLACGTAASASRTGLLQLLGMLFLAWMWNGSRDRRTWQILGCAVATYTLAAQLLPWLIGLDPLAHGITGRLRAGDASCASRSVMWTNVLHLIAQRPWSGWGWMELDYAHFITPYPGARFCEILDNAHNLPLHLAVELGVPASVSVCGLAVLLVWRARPWRETRPERRLAWAVLVLVMVHSMLEYPLWYGPFQIAVLACIGLLLASDPAARTSAGHSVRFGAHTIAVLSLCGLAYTLWDYHRVGQLYLATSERDPAYRVNTLEKVRDSWLFARQVNFAELTTTDVQQDNAERLHAMALELLHFSPEPRVVEKLIDSAALLGREDDVRLYQARFEAAFPVAYAKWLKNRPQP